MHLVIHFTTVILTKFMNGVQSSLVNSTIDFTKNSPKNVLNKKGCCVVNVTSLSIDHYTPIGKDFSEGKKILCLDRSIIAITGHITTKSSPKNAKTPPDR